MRESDSADTSGGAASTRDDIADMDDHAPWGDRMGDKPDNAFRVYCQNVNGIRLGEQYGDLGDLCDLIGSKGIDVCGVVEHNLDQTKAGVLSRCHDATKQFLQRAKLTVAGSDVSMSGAYKPGGTMQITTGPAIGRVQETHTDSMGRWAAQTFRCRGNKRLTIVTAYQVCHASWSLLGKSTAAAQQISALRVQGATNLDPRVHFKKDFGAYLRQLVVDGHSVIAQGDFNEPIDGPASKIADLANRAGLIDILAEQHATLALPSTYVRGRARIDYVLGTPDVQEAVLASGYESPFRYMHSDHRPMWVDFDSNKLFGTALAELPPMEFRDINTRNRARLERYLRRKDELLKARNVYDRVKRLTAAAVPNHQEAERIDRDLVHLSLSAAKRLPRYPDTAWSLELSQAKRKLAILRLHLSSERLRVNVSHKIEYLQAYMNTPVALPEGVDESRQAVAQARAQVRAVEAAADEVRQKEIEAKILEQHAPRVEGEDGKASALKRIRRAEAKRKMYAKLKALRHPGGRQGVDRLEVPTDPGQDPKKCTEWTQVDTPAEIVEHLCRRNQKHFGQAQGTPFTVPPMSEQIDFTASTKATEMILDGSYDTGDMDVCTKLLLKHLQCLPDVKPVKTHMTEQAFTAKLKLWRESTTTSPSGMHLGHWKALVYEFAPPQRKQPQVQPSAPTTLIPSQTITAATTVVAGAKEPTPTKESIGKIQRRLRKAHLAMINYALMWGYSFDRWKGVVNVMILKEPGNVKIHRLRVLHLYEADYNLILAVKWRQLIHTAEDSRALHPGQYGSRPRRQAPDPVFIEEMMNEVARNTRTSLIKFDNDATSCYDRIIPAVAVLASRKYGMPRAVTSVMANTLQAARYKLKTEAGVSDEYYTHSAAAPIYGTGQGSGNSPTIWCVISSTLFDCQEEAMNGATFWSPNKQHRVTFSMVGFVDDSTGQVNDFAADPQPAPAALQAVAKEEAQHWNDILHATGGALELRKCSFHHIHWEYESDGTPAMKPGTFGPTMELVDRHTLERSPIPMMAANTAHKTLGHYKDPLGSQARQLDWLRNKFTGAALFVDKAALSAEEGFTYYHSVFMPSVRFPLGNTFFTHRELLQVETKAHQSMAAAMGFNRHTSKAILYAPAAMGGGGMRHLAVEQGLAQLENFVRHWRSGNTQIGALVRIALHWAQTVAGVSTGLLQEPATNIPHLEAKWFGSLRDFLTAANTQVVVDDDGVVPKQREHDRYIMEVLMSSGKYTPAELRRLNYCRLHLQATLLSDIATADGVAIDPAFERGDATLDSPWDTRAKVHQQRPCEQTWALWRRANRRWSDRKGTLHQPLGKWIVPHSDRHKQWPMYYSATEASVFEVQQGRDKYTRYPALPHGKYCWIDDSTRETVSVAELPDDSDPIRLSDATHYKMFIPGVARGAVPGAAPSVVTWGGLVRQHPRWRQLRLDRIAAFRPDDWANVGLASSRVRLSISTGWTQNAAGEHRFGWLCHDHDRAQVGKCAGTLRHREANPTRVQLHALASALAFAELLARYRRHRGMVVEVGCTDTHIAKMVRIMCTNATLERLYGSRI